MATIRKRGDTYQIRVSLGYNKIGKQVVKTKTFKPAKHLTPKQAELEAQRQAYEFEKVVYNGGIIESESMKLEDFCPLYIDFIKDTICDTTLVAYKRIIKTHILPRFGHMKLITITPMHVQQFISDLSRSRSQRDNKPIAPATVRRYYTVLQSIMSRACKLNLIDVNPCNRSKIDLPKINNTDVEIFTLHECQTIIKALEKEDIMYRVLVTIAILTGCRRGELVALKWSVIDFNTKTLTIKLSNYQAKGQAIQSKEPKTRGSIRQISLDDDCINMLLQYKASQKAYINAIGDKWQGDEWLFTQWDGKPMHPHTPTHWFSDFLEKNSLPHKKFHSLRHTSATLLLAGGTNIKTVSSRLGHSQLSTTNIYIHSVLEADKEASSLISNMMNRETNITKIG